MRTILAALLLASTAVGAVSVDRQATVPVDGGTIFVIDGKYAVTADHCEYGHSFQANLSGRRVTATMVFDSKDEGPNIYSLSEKVEHTFYLAKTAPLPGQAVASVGYPAGNYAYLEGHLIKTDENGFLITDFRWSGRALWRCTAQQQWSSHWDLQRCNPRSDDTLGAVEANPS